MEMEIDAAEAAGGWRLLCASILLQAVQRTEESTKLYKAGRFGIGYDWQNTRNGADKERIKQRTQARDWLDGGIGVITYEECCEVLGLEPELFREKVMEWCRSRKRKPSAGLEVGLV